MTVTIGRRELLAALGGAAAAWPFAARAQQPDRMRLIGVLMAYAESDSTAQSWLAAFRAALAKLGWTPDRTSLERQQLEPTGHEPLRCPGCLRRY
jgi:putative tryptophan/tyrosine transport system substrate-binding protein